MTLSIHTEATHAARVIRPRGEQALPDRATLRNATDSLADWFPVVRVLLWDDPLKTVAEAFLAGQPAAKLSHSSTLEQFPSYLRAYGLAPSIEYLADIAELECAYRLA